MTPEESIALRAPALSPGKQQALLQMRARCRRGSDVLSSSELARLRFARWLYRSGRLTA
jgi:hypothetical protein